MSIQDKLMAWGMGKAMNNPDNGFPKQSPFARFMLNPGDSTERVAQVVPITIDEHTKLDSVISEMSGTKPLHFEVICLAYIRRKKDSAISKILKGKMKASTSTIRTTRENAEFFIDGRLQ